MQEISLIKRILLYGLLFLINLIMGTLLGADLEYFGIFVYKYETISFTILWLMPNYIFGLIFLKTKWIYKLVVPFVTSFYLIHVKLY